MTTDSHTLDRLQMHTGKRIPDSITSCVCLMCKGLHSVHQGCRQVVVHLRSALLQSWHCCLACMYAPLLVSQPSKHLAPACCSSCHTASGSTKDLPCLQLEVACTGVTSWPKLTRPHRAAPAADHVQQYRVQQYHVQQYHVQQYRVQQYHVQQYHVQQYHFSSTMFSNTLFSSNRCWLHCVAGACVAAVSAQAPCCTSPSAVRHRTAALRLHEQLCELHQPCKGPDLDDRVTTSNEMGSG